MTYYLEKSELKNNEIFNLKNILIFLGILIIIIFSCFNNNKSNSKLRNKSTNSSKSISKIDSLDFI
jgi:hypothetical protein